MIGKIDNKEYEVEINKDELIKLRWVIAKKCSLIRHIDHITFSSIEFDLMNHLDVLPAVDKYKCIRNLDRDGEWDYRYHEVYDSYKAPYLVILIDKLLNGNASSIADIYEPDVSSKKIPLDIIVDELNESVKNMKDLVEKRSLYSTPFGEPNFGGVKEQIKSLAEHLELNKNQESTYDYYKKVQELITLKEINRDKINDVEDINNINKQMSLIKKKI